MNIVSQHKEVFAKALEHLKSEIATLRTGRATPALLDNVFVEAYGAKQLLKTVASIAVLDAKTLMVEPWDKSLMPAMEAGLRNSSLGINPVNDGKVIRLPLPDLSTERRQELIKLLHHKLETARIAIRQVREDVKREIDRAEKDKEIGEDQKFREMEELNKLVKEYNEKVKVMGEEKEREINI